MAKIRHIAISTDNYAHVGRWYQAIFGMKTSSTNVRPEAAVVVSDGYIGMNVIPRNVGNAARLDHFGFEVNDPEEIFARLREAYPAISWQKRPSTRPLRMTKWRTWPSVSSSSRSTRPARPSVAQTSWPLCRTTVEPSSVPRRASLASARWLAATSARSSAPPAPPWMDASASPAL